MRRPHPFCGDSAPMRETTTYELVLRGRASTRLLQPLLDDFSVDHGHPGVTRLIGQITDPCHLHGVLAHLTCVGIELISLGPAGAPAHPASSTSDEHDPTRGAST